MSKRERNRGWGNNTEERTEEPEEPSRPAVYSRVSVGVYGWVGGWKEASDGEDIIFVLKGKERKAPIIASCEMGR